MPMYLAAMLRVALRVFVLNKNIGLDSKLVVVTVPCYTTDLSAIQVDTRRHCMVQGFPDKDITKLEDYGFIASRPRGEYHANNQQMAKLLHKAIGLGGKKAAPMVCLASPCHCCFAAVEAQQVWWL